MFLQTDTVIVTKCIAILRCQNKYYTVLFVKYVLYTYIYKVGYRSKNTVKT